jgi:hypothetical protein
VAPFGGTTSPLTRESLSILIARISSEFFLAATITLPSAQLALCFSSALLAVWTRWTAVLIGSVRAQQLQPGSIVPCVHGHTDSPLSAGRVLSREIPESGTLKCSPKWPMNNLGYFQMETIRWKRLIAAKDSGQLIRVSLQLDAHEIRHAVGAHRPWKATASEPWLMVPAADFTRAIALFRD